MFDTFVANSNVTKTRRKRQRHERLQYQQYQQQQQQLQESSHRRCEQQLYKQYVHDEPSLPIHPGLEFEVQTIEHNDNRCMSRTLSGGDDGDAGGDIVEYIENHNKSSGRNDCDSMTSPLLLQSHRCDSIGSNDNFDSTQQQQQQQQQPDQHLLWNYSRWMLSVLIFTCVTVFYVHLAWIVLPLLLPSSIRDRASAPTKTTATTEIPFIDMVIATAIIIATISVYIILLILHRFMYHNCASDTSMSLCKLFPHNSCSYLRSRTQTNHRENNDNPNDDDNGVATAVVIDNGIQHWSSWIQQIQSQTSYTLLRDGGNATTSTSLSSSRTNTHTRTDNHDTSRNQTVDGYV